eukprot:TRINITY_DN10630_c0_g1_i1.p1 TRINITY_DN10630_c0_g1~~TRINITY_DN10630_c0_g1_i1.p1  ORF type:complete len:722 (+),score=100.34 TRINITY_DN10630_c0_g1_i1:81-2246(+)
MALSSDDEYMSTEWAGKASLDSLEDLSRRFELVRNAPPEGDENEGSRKKLIDDALLEQRMMQDGVANAWAVAEADVTEALWEHFSTTAPTKLKDGWVYRAVCRFYESERKLEGFRKFFSEPRINHLRYEDLKPEGLEAVIAAYCLVHDVFSSDVGGLVQMRLQRDGIAGFVQRLQSHDLDDTPPHRMLVVREQAAALSVSAEADARPGADAATDAFVPWVLRRYVRFCLDEWERETVKHNNKDDGLYIQVVKRLKKSTRRFTVLMLGDGSLCDAFAARADTKDGRAHFDLQECHCTLLRQSDLSDDEVLSVGAVLLFGETGWEEPLRSFANRLGGLRPSSGGDGDAPVPKKYLNVAFVLPPPESDPLQVVPPTALVGGEVIRAVEITLDETLDDDGWRYWGRWGRAYARDGPDKFVHDFPVYSFRYRNNGKGKKNITYPTPMMTPRDILQSLWIGWERKWLRPWRRTLVLYPVDRSAGGNIEVSHVNVGEGFPEDVEPANVDDDDEDELIKHIFKDIVEKMNVFAGNFAKDGRPPVLRMVINRRMGYSSRFEAFDRIGEGLHGLGYVPVWPFQVGDMVEVMQKVGRKGGSWKDPENVYIPGRIVRTCTDACQVHISTKPPFTEAQKVLPDVSPRVCAIHTAQRRDVPLVNPEGGPAAFIWDHFLTLGGHTAARRVSFHPDERFYTPGELLCDESSDASGSISEDSSLTDTASDEPPRTPPS